jgi:hypothetical protein
VGLGSRARHRNFTHNKMRLHLFLLPLVLCATAFADELLIGSATIDITPDQPVALAGQFSTRISKTVETPLVESAVSTGESRSHVRMIADIADEASRLAPLQVRPRMNRSSSGQEAVFDPPPALLRRAPQLHRIDSARFITTPSKKSHPSARFASRSR